MSGQAVFLKKATTNSFPDMLIPTIVLPEAIAAPPTDDLEKQELGCEVMLGLLEDLEENCVVIIPHNQTSSEDYYEAVKGWPSKWKIKAEARLGRMRLRHRFVDSKNTYTPLTTSACAGIICQPHLGLCVATPKATLINPKMCIDCINQQGLQEKAVGVSCYRDSKFSKMRSKNLAMRLSDGEFGKKEFEDRVLNPVFAFAKHVKIFDKLIGKIYNNKTDPPSISIPSNFQLSIKWIIGVFVASGAVNRGGTFEIYCSMDDKFSLPPPIKKIIFEEVQRFQAELHRDFSLPEDTIKIFLKANSLSHSFEHDRYLVTDQIVLQVGRGFDLLWSNAKMKAKKTDTRRIYDTNITVLPESDSIEKDVKRLDDFYKGDNY